MELVGAVCFLPSAALPTAGAPMHGRPIPLPRFRRRTSEKTYYGSIFAGVGASARQREGTEPSGSQFLASTPVIGMAHFGSKPNVPVVFKQECLNVLVVLHFCSLGAQKVNGNLLACNGYLAAHYLLCLCRIVHIYYFIILWRAHSAMGSFCYFLL